MSSATKNAHLYVPVLSPDFIHWYLTAFNIFSLVGWTYILVISLLYLAMPSPGSFYSVVSPALCYFESFAVFEIVHVVIGIVPSSVFATIFQG